MAIKVKAIERNVAFVKGEEKWAYVLQADLYSKLSDQKVIQEERSAAASTRVLSMLHGMLSARSSRLGPPKAIQ